MVQEEDLHVCVYTVILLISLYYKLLNEGIVYVLNFNLKMFV